MTEGARSWLNRLEAEIARELGQPVALAAPGDAPEAGAQPCGCESQFRERAWPWRSMREDAAAFWPRPG